jgi:glycosyltransferase involved in cell wall biosynthesis
MPTEGGDGAADVSVCIPAYEAAAFIDRTLACARRQTHARLRILVSIDASEDATESICRRHAAGDPRIEVLAQPRRLGWSENANAVLARVRTPFCFLYFHDDIIVPDYVARLREALLQRPDAASAH